MRLESKPEDIFGFPSGLGEEELISESHADKIKAIRDRVGKIRTKGDIEAIIKMLHALALNP